MWAIVVIGTHAALADCPKEWATGFHAPGVTGTVNAMAVFDDGSGPALYVGGDFDAAGEARCRYVAKWDGIHWSAVGAESSWLVNCLIVFDDGNGPAPYAGTLIGVLRWNGTEWQPDWDGPTGNVLALAVFDDGAGPALYAGGDFMHLRNYTEVGCIARWDGENWSGVGGGVDCYWLARPEVNALVVYDDDSGPGALHSRIFRDCRPGAC